MQSQKTTAKQLILVFALAIFFFGFFRAVTKSEYSEFPRGDARVYSFMAIHFDSPGKTNAPLPLFYSQRLLPSFMGYVLSYPFKDEAMAGHITTPDEVMLPEAKEVNETVFRAWEVSNFMAYAVQLVFLFLLLRRFDISAGLSCLLLAVYSSWFLTLRLYMDWVQMADPWAFAFLAASSYFLVISNNAGFLAAVTLGTLCKESVLLMVPAYLWKAVSEKRFKGAQALSLALIAIVPAGVFFLARHYPYFPSAMSTPNAPEWAVVSMGKSEGPLGFISDYLFLVKFHLLYKIKEGLGPFLMDSVLIPFGTFSALLCVLLWKIRESFGLLNKYRYWIPFILLTEASGFNVGRHLVYLFPVIVLFSGLVLQRCYRKKYLLYIAAFIAVITFFQNQGYKAPSADEMGAFAYRHQLELSVDYAPQLASAYRRATVVSAVFTFAGFWIIGRLQRKNGSQANA